MPALNLIFRSGSNRVFGCACSLLLAVAIARCGGLSGQTSTNLPPPSPPPATQSTCATPAASNPVGGGGIYTQIAIDPGVYGKRDPSGLTVFGFSQEGQNLPTDPQVLAMSPNIVPRAWQRWDRGGVQPSDYNFELSNAGACGRHHVHRRNNSHCSLQGRVSGSVGIQCSSLMRCDGPAGVSCCDEILPR